MRIRQHTGKQIFVDMGYRYGQREKFIKADEFKATISKELSAIQASRKRLYSKENMELVNKEKKTATETSKAYELAHMESRLVGRENLLKQMAEALRVGR